MSDLSKSLTVAHLIWVKWANERMSNERKSEWANSQPWQEHDVYEELRIYHVQEHDVYEELRVYHVQEHDIYEELRIYHVQEHDVYE